MGEPKRPRQEDEMRTVLDIDPETLPDDALLAHHKGIAFAQERLNAKRLATESLVKQKTEKAIGPLLAGILRESSCSIASCEVNIVEVEVAASDPDALPCVILKDEEAGSSPDMVPHVIVKFHFEGNGLKDMGLAGIKIKEAIGRLLTSLVGKGQFSVSDETIRLEIAGHNWAKVIANTQGYGSTVIIREESRDDVEQRAEVTLGDEEEKGK